jgi:hypothetical protein
LNNLHNFIIFFYLTGFITTFSIAQEHKREIEKVNSVKRFSFSIYAAYISSSELQDNIRSNDPISRNSYVELDGGYGFGGEITFDPHLFNTGIIFYLSGDFFKKEHNNLEYYFDNGTNTATLRMVETISCIPVEFGVKWDLPVSSRLFKVYIGGGGGFYFGQRNRTLSNLVYKTINTNPGFSLNVLTGAEYKLSNNLSFNAEVKFREGTYEVESEYDRNAIIVKNYIFELTNPFYSRININGVRISAGFKFYF